MSDVTIREERVDDIGAISDVVAAAFKSPVEARLVDAIRASANFVPEWSLVAEIDGRVVGHVMVSFVGLREEAKERRVCSLAPLAVAPDLHGRGIGSRLVRAVTAKVDAAGQPLIVLEGSPVFYGRLGFEYSVPYGIHIDLPEWAPAEAAQIMRLAGYDPSIRGKIAYPPAFDDVTPER